MVAWVAWTLPGFTTQRREWCELNRGYAPRYESSDDDDNDNNDDDGDNVTGGSGSINCSHQVLHWGLMASAAQDVCNGSGQPLWWTCAREIWGRDAVQWCASGESLV